MIAKRVARRKDSKSSIKQLVNYIVDEPNQGEKVGRLIITNCLSDSKELAIKEMLATQSLNTKSKNDKTYHLIVSFRSGENPSIEQLADIEAELCNAIGLGEHQRISAVHTDTDNKHLHIAINKVHPETYRCIEPYYDHYKLNDVCKELEQKHGLEVDNRIDKTKPRQGYSKVSDIELQTGLQSFKTWVCNEPKKMLAELLKSEDLTWKKLHESMAEFNLAILKHGAGLVIGDKDNKLFVKASSVLRELSYGSLEKKLGEYQAPDELANNIMP